MLHKPLLHDINTTTAAAMSSVYPLFMLDDNKVLNSIVVAWTLRFNDVLDPDRLHTSLCRLLEIGDWRKLGGRLTRKV